MLQPLHSIELKQIDFISDCLFSLSGFGFGDGNWKHTCPSVTQLVDLKS